MEKPKCFVCYCKDEELRLNSTSGGFFGVLAQEWLRKSGVIYGARFDTNFNVIHDRASDEEEWKKFQGSKYVQSDKGNIFQQIKIDLIGGKKVLFTGTPCEVNGLLRYLENIDTSELLCMDFICLGIPSPLVWKKYFNEVTEGKKVKSVSFKDKKNGWKNFTFVINFQDGSQWNENGRENLFFQGLFRKLYVRPSCYECPYRNVNHAADFTVGDAWGIDILYPEMIDNKGATSLLVQSEKGIQIFKMLKTAFIWKEITICELISGNQNMVKKPEVPKNRDKFFAKMINGTVNSALRSCMKSSVYSKCIKRFKKIVKGGFINEKL